MDMRITFSKNRRPALAILVAIIILAATIVSLQLMVEAVPAASPQTTTTYTYDDAGRLTGVEYPNGSTIDYTYDNAGNLQERDVVAVTVQYTLTMGKTGQGTVDPTEGTHDYNQGSVVNVTATAATGWSFVNWTGDVATIADENASSTTITMDSDYSIVANFGESGVWDPWNFDADQDGDMSKQEALNAVVAFFGGDITKQQALEVIVLFFS